MDYDLREAAILGYLNRVPVHILTEQSLTLPDVLGQSPMHHAANLGRLHLVPKSCLTYDTMLVRDWNGYTPLHWAASKGQLDMVPSALLNAKNIMTQIDDGRSVLHFAAASDIGFAQIPLEILTPENLLLKAGNGVTSLYLAAHFGNLGPLMGMDFGASTAAVRKIVGEDWWAAYQSAMSDKTGLSVAEEAVGMDVF